VRKKRRIELHIEYREISFFAGAATLSGRTIDPHPPAAAGVIDLRHAFRATCGSTGLVLLRSC
jgi:hypothetical protein